MPSSAALLSANTSLSAILGGTAGIGNGSVAAATGTSQGTDFSSLLSASPDLVPAATAKPTLPPGATGTDDADALFASGSDQAAASSGKSLPLAALVSAAMPVPVTLSALVQTPGKAASTSDDGDQPAAPAIDLTGSDTRALALMAMAHGTTPPAQPVQTTQPTQTGMQACASLTPVNTSATIQAAYVKDDQTPRSLPHPGFTLLPDTAGDVVATTQAATTQAATPAVATPSTQPAITLTAATAIAMADPAQVSASMAQPGFTLLADMTPVAGTPATTPQLAGNDRAITLTPDTSVAMAPTSTVAPTGPRLADARPDTDGQDAVTSATATTAAVRMAQLAPVAATPVALSASAATDAAPNASTPTATVRLASARGSTQGKVTTVATRNAAARADIRADTTARPAIDLDTGDAEPGFSAHSSTSPSADGASTLENAPSLVQPLASAGTAAVAQTLAATGGAATTTLATQQGGTDMAALVDRLVEARAAARSGLSSQVVQASLTHADFGRVSLRFNNDGDGLSVSMASSDPGFAPAAQAALAQMPAVSASAQGHGAGQQNMGQQSSGQPGQHWAQNSGQAPLQANTGGTGSSSGNGGQGWTQGGQNSASASRTTPAAQARATSTATSTSPRNRGGILA